MRIVHLTTEFPWPATSGGPVRTLSQLRILASLAEVDSIALLSVAETPVRDDARRALERAIPKVRVAPPVFHPVHLFQFKRFVPRVVALRALRGVPYLAAKWDSRRLRKALRRELAATPVDVVYVDHLGMAIYARDVKSERPHARIVLDQHNVESDFFGQFAERQRGPKRLVARAEHGAAQAFEKEAMRAADAVVAISNEDRARFRDLAGVNAEVVPVVLDFERRVRPRPARTHFCYVGNLRWHPNVEGLDWFCRDVWPRVRARLPDATFEIAGVGLDQDERGALRVPSAWQVPGVTTTGFLEDLEPLYARSLAMLAPITGGSGVRMKLLEGFRAGVPVVTTSDGALGLPIVSGDQALVADDPAGFAEHVVHLAEDETLREHLRDGGYAHLERHHSLEAAQAIMRGALGLPQPRA